MSYDTLLAKSPGIIYRPGGVAGGLVATTWLEVQDFLALRSGVVCIVYVDDSIVTPALVPATSGMTDVSRVEFRSFRQDISSNFPTLVVEDGAQLKNLYKVSGTLEILFDTKGAIPGLAYDFGTIEPIAYVEDGGAIGTTTTCTTSPCVIPAASTLDVFISGAGASIFLQSAASFFDLTSVTSSVAALLADGNSSDNWATGAGTAILAYDSESITLNFESPSGGVPTAPGVARYIVFQKDTQEVELTFTTTTGNALSPLQTGAAGFAPKRGLAVVRAEGFGGSGGGGGGEGGGAANGVGGGGSGGAQYYSAAFVFDLSHSMTVNVGSAGVGGAAGAAGNGPGGIGTDGGPSSVLDATSNTTLASFLGSSGGQGGGVVGGVPGHGGAFYAGAVLVPKITDIGSSPYGSGFIGAGGLGGAGGAPGTSGQSSPVAGIIAGGATTWGAGAGGTSAAGEGGGGGGGGGGVFGPAGAGGNGAPAGTPGGSGNPAPLNSGAGAGGGAGGGGATDAGGAGGGGSTGWVRITLSISGAPPTS